MDDRIQPSALDAPLDLVPLNPPVIANAPPQIVNFTAEQVGNGLYVFTGQVLDESPGGLTVTFGGGVPSVAGLTATTDADGTFSLTVRLQTDGTDSGTVSVTTVDPLGAVSNEALVDVSPTP